MGLTLIRSDKERAPRNVAGSEGPDFYDMAAVHVKQTLKNPRKINYLKLKLAGLQGTGFDEAILNEGRQRLRQDILEIFQEVGPDHVLSEASNAVMTPAVKSFLLPGINIQSNDKNLMAKAQQIAGDIKDPEAAARKLMGWVYENVEKRRLSLSPAPWRF